MLIADRRCECLRFGEVERVQSFAAEMDGPMAVRFTQAASAQACLWLLPSSGRHASDCSHHQCRPRHRRPL